MSMWTGVNMERWRNRWLSLSVRVSLCVYEMLFMPEHERVCVCECINLWVLVCLCLNLPVYGLICVSVSAFMCVSLWVFMSHFLQDILKILCI